MGSPKPVCKNCRWHLFVGEGYSNWTWMETDSHCLKDLNPGFPVSSLDDVNVKNHYAEKCKEFFFDPIDVEIDPDREDVDRSKVGPERWEKYCSDDPERLRLIYELLDSEV